MTILNVLTWPDPFLRQTAKPVTDFGPELKTLIDDLFETLYAQKGAGLAAPQVGILQRLCVVDIRQGEPLALVNPRIVAQDEEIEWTEGCLSLPGVRAKVPRFNNITVEYQTPFGDTQTLLAHELLAVCIAHECDHLDGRLYFDRLGSLEARALLNNYFDLNPAKTNEDL